MAKEEDPHFDISAAVVRQLGEELVTDEVTALVELVKNAYDADATFAHVVVDTVGSLGPDFRFTDAQGFITVEDDGFGMDRADIISGWLMISLSRKREMKAKKQTTPKGRTPLGDKGLGRLSTQKLGRNLEMLTRREKATAGLHVSFEWDAFTDDKSLSQVPVEIEPTARLKKQGTTLAISKLRNPDVWRGAAAEQLVGDLSQIISPFPDARPFIVTLKIDGRPVDLGQISERVRDAAVGKFDFRYSDKVLSLSGKIRLAKLRGNQGEADFDRLLGRDNGRSFAKYLKQRKLPVRLSFDADGPYFTEFDYRVQLKDLGQVEHVTVDEKAQPADPGPFRGQIDDFVFRGDIDAVKLSGLANATEISQIIKQHAGIKVFRDGFAVKPYGINGQDWLRLSAQQTSGGSWYGLRPQNAIGFVAISEAVNNNLKDKTDREGFVANPWSNNFQRLMIHAVETIANTYEAIRRAYNDFKAAEAANGRPFSQDKQLLTDADSVASRLSAFATRAKSLETRISTARGNIKDATTKIQRQPVLSSAAERELAGLLDEARQSLEASEGIFAELSDYAEQAKELAQIVGILHPKLEVMSDQLEGFSELAGLGLLAETLSHEVQNQTDRLMHKANAAVSKARKTVPENLELRLFGQEVLSAASALRRQIGHLTPSLRYQRDKIDDFAVGELLKDIEEHFSDRWTSENFPATFVVAGESFDVSTNRGRLTQVIDNLILNAEYWLKEQCRADTKFGPVVHMETGASKLRVWDNGRGIAEAVEDSLFEPFVTLKPKNQGRGLGLFINTQIMESLGGSITLLPDRNAEGRRYIFELDLSGIVHGQG